MTFRLESQLQRACVRFARARGWLARRGAGQGRRSFPDYWFLRCARFWLVEFKRPGCAPTELQELEHRELRAHGADVSVIDDLEVFKKELQAREPF
jgi:hypothetical protein